MPKLKKAPRNSYFFFITKRREMAEAEGYIIRGGFQEASHAFGSEWGRLSKEERAPYEEMAKEAKEQDKYNVGNKFTTSGESYAQVFQQDLERQTAQQQMETFVDSMTSGSEAGNRIYIFMKCVYSVEMIKDKKTRSYLPAEISLAAFTLKGGIKSVYTTLIDTQKVPMGYASSAAENAEDSLLPLPGHSSYTPETRDYIQILGKIFGFTNHFQKGEGGYDMPGHYRVFFCQEAEKEPIISGLQWLINQLEEGKTRKKYENLMATVKVYGFNKLILGMAKEAKKVNPSYSNYMVTYQLNPSADSILLKGNYDYRPEIACLFHGSGTGNRRMNNCAQSIVMRRIFMLFEEFVTAYNYEWTERHKIDNVVKGFQPTMIEERREVKPVENVVVTEIPDWLKDDPKPKSKAHFPSPSLEGCCEPSWLNSEPASSPSNSAKCDEAMGPDEDYDDDGLPAWTRASPPASTFQDEDFPSLGGDGGPPSGGSAATWGGRGRGRGLSTYSSSQSEEYTSGSGPSMRSPPQAPTYASKGRGRGLASSAATASMEFDGEDFPTLGSTIAGRGRGRGRGGNK
ncbi:unnamed protein product [Orchesella dallaii]|uniref:HMG box domain-containing protein n=1 Tax=Orchesella dallaii TaxID=48710 RepID=A0ABP1QPE6_9HEXA